MPALLAEACNDDYRSYHTNEDYLTREQLGDVFTGMGQIVPDLAWRVVDIHVVDDLMIVRGEATGTPVAEFWGVAPTVWGSKTRCGVLTCASRVIRSWIIIGCCCYRSGLVEAALLVRAVARDAFRINATGPAAALLLDATVTAHAPAACCR